MPKTVNLTFLLIFMGSHQVASGARQPDLTKIVSWVLQPGTRNC